MTAAKSGHLAVVQRLLRAGVILDKMDNWVSFENHSHAISLFLNLSLDQFCIGERAEPVVSADVGCIQQSLASGG